MSKTAAGLVAYCKAQLGKPYWYGTFGQTATAALYYDRKAMYPGYYTADNFMEQLGQRVHDCVGLIKGYLWSATPTSTPVYTPSEDVNVPMLYNRCTERGTLSSLPEIPGVCVFMTSMEHVGVYIGNGKVIEARGHAWGVVETNLKDRGWGLWGKPQYIDYSVTPEPEPVFTPKRGIDISWWNKDVDMEAAKRDGVEFAIIRAGRRANKIDEYAEPNAKRAAKAGIPIGYYWFSYATTVEEAIVEADSLCDEVERIGIEPEYPLCYDYEYASYDDCAERGVPAPSRATIVKMARAFLNRVRERGYYPCNYTNIDFLDNWGFSELTGEFDTWLAQWGVSSPTRDCTIWQWGGEKKSWQGHADGVDMNICYVDYPSIISGDTPTPKPDPEPTPTPTPTPTPSGGTCMVDCKILRKGDFNDTVKSWQALLNVWGYNCGTPDRSFGDKTEEQTKKFQKDYGLEPDGIVGKLTWNMMMA